jgi:hypothetical protein
MKRFGKLKLFGLVAFLTAALIFVGIDYLEGKKPPKWEWKVEIPNELDAETLGCNLYGNNEIYENNDFVDVGFSTYEDKDTVEFHSTFSLKIENTQKGISSLPGYYSIGFREVEFRGCKSYCYLGGTGPCRSWVFPNYGLTGVDCCEPLCSGPGSPDIWVMKEFMEESAHPRDGYDHFSLRFWVYTDIEAIEIDDYWKGEGYMWRMNVWNTDDTLLTGSEKYHNIMCQYTIPLEEVLVERLGENEWMITVDQCGEHIQGENDCESLLTNNSGRYIAFWEFYYQGIEKQRGKSGKSYIEPVGRRALGGSTAFKFITKWTRY